MDLTENQFYSHVHYPQPIHCLAQSHQYSSTRNGFAHVDNFDPQGELVSLFFFWACNLSWHFYCPFNHNVKIFYQNSQNMNSYTLICSGAFCHFSSYHFAFLVLIERHQFWNTLHCSRELQTGRVISSLLCTICNMWLIIHMFRYRYIGWGLNICDINYRLKFMIAVA